jgi:siroheme synthase (precorrin-2 oxidase/ferrochelatase)
MSCYNFITKVLHRRKIQAEMPPSETEVVQGLKKLLEDKNRELQLKEEMITLLEKELDDKDVIIKHLHNEIDKFRQVVKPITQKIITKQLELGDERPRIKRQAISAEPLNASASDLQIKKIPKSATSNKQEKSQHLTSSVFFLCFRGF